MTADILQFRLPPVESPNPLAPTYEPTVRFDVQQPIHSGAVSIVLDAILPQDQAWALVRAISVALIATCSPSAAEPRLEALIDTATQQAAPTQSEPVGSIAGS